MRSLLCAVVLLLGAPSLTGWAQDAPRPETLVRTWLSGQTALADDLERVELREQSEWTLDGPFGVRRIGLTADIRGGPAADGWRRTPIAVSMNGRRIPPRRWEEIEQQRRAMIGPTPETAARVVIYLHQLVRTLEPTGRTTPEVLGGVALWRVELASPGRVDAVQRYTLWFDRDRGHLIRSRAVIQGRRRDAPFTVTTEYERLEGFDVPRLRHMEGTAQMKRRLRTYTLLFDYRATYSDYRFFRR